MIDQHREFTHVDVLPTLAEAIGLTWQPAAHQLGLGRSLLTTPAQPTLAERDGLALMNGGCPAARQGFNGCGWGVSEFNNRPHRKSLSRAEQGFGVNLPCALWAFLCVSAAASASLAAPSPEH